MYIYVYIYRYIESDSVLRKRVLGVKYNNKRQKNRISKTGGKTFKKSEN